MEDRNNKWWYVQGLSSVDKLMAGAVQLWMAMTRLRVWLLSVCVLAFVGECRYLSFKNSVGIK